MIDQHCSTVQRCQLVVVPRICLGLERHSCWKPSKRWRATTCISDTHDISDISHRFSCHVSHCFSHLWKLCTGVVGLVVELPTLSAEVSLRCRFTVSVLMQVKVAGKWKILIQVQASLLLQSSALNFWSHNSVQVAGPPRVQPICRGPWQQTETFAHMCLQDCRMCGHDWRLLHKIFFCYLCKV